MAVRGVLAETGIDDHQQIGDGLLDGADGLLHDPFGVPGFAADVVFLGRQPEQDDRRDAEFRDLPSLPREPVDRQVKLSG